MAVNFHHASQTYGFRLFRLPYVVLFGPRGFGLLNKSSDYINIPLGAGWRFVIRR